MSHWQTGATAGQDTKQQQEEEQQCAISVTHKLTDAIESTTMVLIIILFVVFSVTRHLFRVIEKHASRVIIRRISHAAHATL